MSAEEGMRRELTIGEPTETAGNPAFYASSVSTSAATFPMGEGLDRLILNDTTITTALEWLRKSFNLFGHPQHAERMEAVRLCTPCAT